jgi:hypothetical protein
MKHTFLFGSEIANRKVREVRQENLLKLRVLCGLGGSFGFSRIIRAMELP